MSSLLIALCGVACVAWASLVALPWQPHRLRERLEPLAGAATDLHAVSVLIPARDEAAHVGRTIAALAAQGRGLEVIVIDDQSSDGTAAAARAAAPPDEERLALRVIAGSPLPSGWAGKLWALEQGLAEVERPFVLLLDADIELARGVLPALLDLARARQLGLVSLMATLDTTTLWERLLAPAFIFFFKLLYPFALANDPARRMAAGAGGCMLAQTAKLRALGGFAAIRGALIDDCTLAAAMKRSAPIFIGVSRAVVSRRVYAALGDFWRMVSRSAFTQLKYSTLLLLATTVAMAVTLLAPIVALVAAAFGAQSGALATAAALAWAAMTAVYYPTIRFYRLSPLYALSLPIAAALFLAMTWTSAFRYWRGTRAVWKNRSYEAG